MPSSRTEVVRQLGVHPQCLLKCELPELSKACGIAPPTAGGFDVTAGVSEVDDSMTVDL
jgi:hypothetical protein